MLQASLSCAAVTTLAAWRGDIPLLLLALRQSSYRCGCLLPAICCQAQAESRIPQSPDAR